MKPEVTKAAMDAALRATREAAVKDTIAQQNAIRDAEKAVRPYVGELAMAHDSAEGVYCTALKALPSVNLTADELKGLPLDALRAILKAQPLPGTKNVHSDTTALGMDAAGVKSYRERFPETARIGHLG